MSAALVVERPVTDEPAHRTTWPSRLLALITVAVLVSTAAGWFLAWRTFDPSPGDTSVEAGFARDMSTHHEQAVEMASIVQDRTEDPLVAGLARDIMMTQQHQMGQMYGWLSAWGLLPTGSQPSMAWMGHATAGRMPGMASPEEIARLSQLSGEAADREFLRLMICHHEGGVPMAQAALERSDNDVVRTLAESILTSQTIEVQTMRSMLERKGG